MKGLIRQVAIYVLLVGILYGVFCLAYLVDRVSPYTPETKELTLEEKKAIYESEQESLANSAFY